MYTNKTTSGRNLGMCSIICMIVGPPIRGFMGRATDFFWGGLFSNFLGGISPLEGVV
jgi:hypothetical protein